MQNNILVLITYTYFISKIKYKTDIKKILIHKKKILIHKKKKGILFLNLLNYY